MKPDFSLNNFKDEYITTLFCAAGNAKLEVHVLPYTDFLYYTVTIKNDDRNYAFNNFDRALEFFRNSY